MIEALRLRRGKFSKLVGISSTNKELEILIHERASSPSGIISTIKDCYATSQYYGPHEELYSLLEEFRLV